MFKTFLTQKFSKVKSTDAELARVQAHILDLVRPLTYLLSSQEDENFTAQEARCTLEDTIKLLGNGSSQVSNIRRKRILN